MTQCQRLEAYLKRAGLNIETQRKKVKNQFGESCSVALYVLKQIKYTD